MNGTQSKEGRNNDVCRKEELEALIVESETRSGIVSSYLSTVGYCKVSVAMDYPSRHEGLLFTFDDSANLLPSRNVSLFYLLP